MPKEELELLNKTLLIWDTGSNSDWSIWLLIFSNCRSLGTLASVIDCGKLEHSDSLLGLLFVCCSLGLQSMDCCNLLVERLLPFINSPDILFFQSRLLPFLACLLKRGNLASVTFTRGTLQTFVAQVMSRFISSMPQTRPQHIETDIVQQVSCSSDCVSCDKLVKGLFDDQREVKVEEPYKTRDHLERRLKPLVGKSWGVTLSTDKSSKIYVLVVSCSHSSSSSFSSKHCLRVHKSKAW